jgi:DNA repair photolyase
MGASPNPRPRGRGTGANPKNRFEALEIEAALDPSTEAPEERHLPTQLLVDSSRSIIARNDSPDVGFETSVNPYRGCEHGCIYCFARPFHEYLGFSAGLDFETRILVKPQAPELLRRELMSPSWEPQLVMLSGVTDCYQPAERRLEITRRCLAVLAELRNPAGVITKNRLVTRDIDLLGELARHQAVAVTLSITTLDPEVARRMEPRASSPRDRLAAVSELAAAGIPVGVNVAPIIPALTDHELPAILAAAKEAGAHWAKYLLVRLPFAVKDLFQEWLAEHFPERKEKVLARLRDLRGGKLNDPRFGERHRGQGPFADQLRMMYETTCRRLDLPTDWPALSTAAFRRPGEQLGLF